MNPTLFQQVASTSLSLPPDSYIYCIVPWSGGIAAISSDDSLRLFDRQTLQLLLNGVLETHHNGITCLTPANATGDLLATAGREGSARIWDIRQRRDSARFSYERSPPITALACDSRRNCLVLGTELTSSQASVVAWDLRAPSTPLFHYVESHNDDITDLQFHPEQESLLLSGSTDGLVNIYDTSIKEEEDALYQVINHGSVHHAGFITADAVYALSHDEIFAIHPLNSANDGVEAPPTLFGDLRPLLDCEYAVEVVMGAQGPALATGNHSSPRLDLVLLTANPSWNFDTSGTIRLPGAHGEEIVRSVSVDAQARSVFTAGEDGLVRVWREERPGEEPSIGVEQRSPATKGGRGKKESRFKPY